MTTDNGAKAPITLRTPFPPEAIGKLPRKIKDQHGNVTGTIQLDYVGHAAVTDRLLTVDPGWNWQPVARDVDPAVLAAAAGSGNPEVVRLVLESAPPLMDLDAKGRPIGLWIKLTANGMTRLGYGSVSPGAIDAEKQLIGDALRNAAMRFGVALDLWTKNDLESEADSGDNGHRLADRSRRRGQPSEAEAAPPEGPPWWEALGYADQDEATSLNDSLRDMMGRVDKDHAGPMAAVFDGLGYPAGQRLPVHKDHVEQIRDALRTALELQVAEAGDEQPNAVEVEVGKLTSRQVEDELESLGIARAKTVKENRQRLVEARSRAGASS